MDAIQRDWKTQFDLVVAEKDMIEQQRDELAEALELLHGHAQLFLGHYTQHHNVFASTVAALAKVKK